MWCLIIHPPLDYTLHPGLLWSLPKLLASIASILISAYYEMFIFPNEIRHKLVQEQAIVVTHGNYYYWSFIKASLTAKSNVGPFPEKQPIQECTFDRLIISLQNHKNQSTTQLSWVLIAARFINIPTPLWLWAYIERYKKRACSSDLCK